jgi:hypothetical protein
MSGIATGTALAVGLGAAGSVAGAGIAAHGAGQAAKTQAQAAEDAANLQYKSGQEALDFTKQQYAQGYQNLFPYLSLGTGGLVNLANLLGINIPGSGGSSGSSATGQRNATPMLGPDTRSALSLPLNAQSGVNGLQQPDVAGPPDREYRQGYVYDPVLKRNVPVRGGGQPSIRSETLNDGSGAAGGFTPSTSGGTSAPRDDYPQ